MRGLISVALAMIVGATAYGEIVVTPESPQAGQLVRVTYDEGDRVGVIPAGAGYSPDVHSCHGALVWTGPPGLYTIVGWSGEQFIYKQVTIGGHSPNPGPGPGPTPDPAVVDDTMGVGRLAYDNAVALRDKATAKTLSEIWNTSAQTLFEKPEATVESAIQYIEKTSNERLTVGTVDRWRTWARAVEKRFDEIKIESKLDHIRAFREVARALAAAAR